MKLLTKFMAVLSAVLFVVSLSACGKGGEENATGSTVSEAAATQDATEETAEETSEEPTETTTEETSETAAETTAEVTTEAKTEATTAAKTEAKTQAAGPEFQWMSYRLVQVDIRPANDDEIPASFDVDALYGMIPQGRDDIEQQVAQAAQLFQTPEGQRYVVAELKNADGGVIQTDDLNRDKRSEISLKTPSGEEYDTYSWAWDASGSTTSYIKLIYLVPEDTPLSDCSLRVK